jgi:hypothetical protein
MAPTMRLFFKKNFVIDCDSGSDTAVGPLNVSEKGLREAPPFSVQ